MRGFRPRVIDLAPLVRVDLCKQLLRGMPTRGPRVHVLTEIARPKPHGYSMLRRLGRVEHGKELGRSLRRMHLPYEEGQLVHPRKFELRNSQHARDCIERVHSVGRRLRLSEHHEI